MCMCKTNISKLEDRRPGEFPEMVVCGMSYSNMVIEQSDLWWEAHVILVSDPVPSQSDFRFWSLLGLGLGFGLGGLDLGLGTGNLFFSSKKKVTPTTNI